MRLATFNSRAEGFAQRLESLVQRGSEPDASILRQVRTIIDAVRARGDAALLEFTHKYDRWQAASAVDLEISAAELQQSLDRIPADLRSALEEAAMRIRAFHECQLQESWTIEDGDGNTLGQRTTPLERVGVYVPGGKAAYPSSVLMNILPAKVAGVEEVIMVVPTPDGTRNDLALAAAALAGADRAFAIGGAQAVAALAYGTEIIPKVDKITGPGNVWVATAKREVFGAVGIDMIAGPSEILIIADASADPEWLAMDMFAQLEHDELAQAILLTPAEGLPEQVADAIERLLPDMQRMKIIEKSLAHSAAILTCDLAEAAEIANRIAPEHLELALQEPEGLLDAIRHAGAIFLGHWSAEVMGDYCAGPNHVLPTGRTARFSSPLGVQDFQNIPNHPLLQGGDAGRLAEIAASRYGEGLMPMRAPHDYVEDRLRDGA
ncbi:MAG: histidinol dehydrogenase [Candidatus Eutrophobiaceae bacterium]